MEVTRKLRDNFNSPQEVLLFARIFLLITVLPLLIKFLSLPRLMRLLSQGSSGGAGTGGPEDYQNRVVRFTDYLLTRDFWIYRKTCLKRSLVLYHFLRPVVPELNICFGVRTGGGGVRDKRRGLDGHSWLIRNEIFFLEEQPELAKKYVVTYRFPDNEATRKTSSKNLTDLSSENRLLLYCSRASASERNTSELNDLVSGPLDWAFISEAASSHNLSQLLYHNLKGLANRSFVPPPVMEDMKNAYHEAIAKNMYIYAELWTILDAFHRAGLKTIVLKGAALAGIVYRDIGLRPMRDIDLLVKEDELAVADKIMTNLDYSAIHGWKSPQWHKENHFHLPPYRHIRKPVVVEIHWHVTGNPCLMDIQKWWKRAVVTDLMGHPVLVPSAEDMLIHLSLHLFNHGYQKGFVLRCLCDIFETLRHYEGEIDWGLLRHEIREQGIEKQVYSILYLAWKSYAPRDHSFVPMNLDRADHHFLRVLEDSLFMDNGNAPINPHLLKSMMLDNFRKKMRYLLPRIFPSRQQMLERYPASSFPAMLFFYYLVRPFDLLARYGRSAARIYRTERDGKE